MKTNLLFSVMLAGVLSLNSLAQNYELWGLKGGAIYKTDGNCENYEVVYDWPGSEGQQLSGSLILASNGKFYGMTPRGGTNNMGVIFEYDRKEKLYINKIEFDGTNGSYPAGSLIQASNGKFYGMTQQGGDNNYGVIFEYDLENNTLIKLLDFNNKEDDKGLHPMGSLMQANNGKLYGLTSEGGLYAGVFFEYDLTNNIYTVLKEFEGINNGRAPEGSVMQADNEKIYGMTKKGGSHDLGVLFEYDPDNNIFLRKISFDGADHGAYPCGNLIQASDGELYGVTAYGGTTNVGIIFSYNIANNIATKRFDIVSADQGAYPQGSLLQASNGKMYAGTSLGACSSGAIFEFDPVADTAILKVCHGYPKGNLIEIEALCIETTDTISETACDSYTSPSGKYTWTVSGTYADTLTNSEGCDSIISINLTVNTVDISVTQDGINLSANLNGASYQWLDCDNENAKVSGATDQSFTATANGSYAVAITHNSCTDTSACLSVTTVGIDGNIFGSEIKLYPNPANGDVTIESLNNTDTHISIFNITGKKVYAIENVIETKVVLPAENLPPGVYFVKIQSNKQQIMLKLVKQ